MKTLNPAADLDRFLSRLSTSASSGLILDYDGTLAPFRQERNRAVPYEGVRKRLATLADKSPHRLFIVSGRPAEDVKRLLDLTVTPEIWGLHGGERLLPGGHLEQYAMSETVRNGLSAIDLWAEQHHLSERIERKKLSRAFHWRGLSDRETTAMARTIERAWSRRADNYDLILNHFDGGIELRPVGITKARAVTAIIKDLPATALLAYLGDDQTDEDAFAALENRGLCVLVRKDMRSTRADLWLHPPDELLLFLDRWLEAVSAQHDTRP